jgi:peroxiredoxin
MLALQNGRLRDMNNALVLRHAAPSAGSWLPQLSINTIDGAPLQIGQPAKRTQLLYFFNPDCPACEASLPSLVSLQHAVGESRSRSVDLIGVSHPTLDRTRRYAADHGLSFPITIPDPRSKNLLGVRVTPVLLVVGAGGRVELTHVGVLDDHALKKILAAIPPDGRVDDATIAQKENFR